MLGWLRLVRILRLLELCRLVLRDRGLLGDERLDGYWITALLRRKRSRLRPVRLEEGDLLRWLLRGELLLDVGGLWHAEVRRGDVPSSSDRLSNLRMGHSGTHTDALAEHADTVGELILLRDLLLQELDTLGSLGDAVRLLGL